MDYDNPSKAAMPLAGYSAGRMAAEQRMTLGEYPEQAKTIATREKGLPAELAELDEALKMHGEAVGRLVASLEGVLLPSPPEVDRSGATHTPQRNLCQAGERVRIARHQVEAMTQVLRDLTRRVDV